MPELPEVEALDQDLRRRLDGHAIARVELVAFSALKTYDPPLQALHGTLVDGVERHGKFLDITASGTHLIVHLARAGWIRWRDEVPPTPPRPSNKSPLAARVVLDDGSGTDRVILSGIHAYYEPEDLVGKTLVAITNLPPRKMMGIDSCGMLISAVHAEGDEERLNLLQLDPSIPAGAKLC